MHIKDSLTGQLRPVRPSRLPLFQRVERELEVVNVLPSHVTIYACGITPYSSAHVGHARTYVVFDLLAKVLRAQGHTVDLARNITDIDDKIIAAAAAQGVSWQELSEHYAQENRDLMVRTGVAPCLEPKASEHLPQMFALIRELMGKGLAYVGGTGDVLYRVSAYKGQLLMEHQEGSTRSEAGQSRVGDAGKEDPRDFALWKRMATNTPGFPSPWGWGRPGWHIECSAMIGALFGGSVTIHGGGVDLKFPHHQAEIMQSEPVFNRPLADIWMHNGSVTSDGQKMSKSQGNFVTWQSALDTADRLAPGLGGQLLRVALMQAHWQKPLDWTEDLLRATHKELLALSQAAAKAKDQPAAPVEPFIEQLAQNLNVPAAWVWLREQAQSGHHAQVRVALQFLGADADQWAAMAVEPSSLAPAHQQEVADLQALREAARQRQDWATADALRLKIQALGVAVSDRKHST